MRPTDASSTHVCSPPPSYLNVLHSVINSPACHWNIYSTFEQPTLSSSLCIDMPISSDCMAVPPLPRWHNQHALRLWRADSRHQLGYYLAPKPFWSWWLWDQTIHTPYAYYCTRKITLRLKQRNQHGFDDWAIVPTRLTSRHKHKHHSPLEMYEAKSQYQMSMITASHDGHRWSMTWKTRERTLIRLRPLLYSCGASGCWGFIVSILSGTARYAFSSSKHSWLHYADVTALRDTLAIPNEATLWNLAGTSPDSISMVIISIVIDTFSSITRAYQNSIDAQFDPSSRVNQCIWSWQLWTSSYLSSSWSIWVSLTF